jgi:hypothetical protein
MLSAYHVDKRFDDQSQDLGSGKICRLSLVNGLAFYFTTESQVADRSRQDGCLAGELLDKSKSYQCRE